MKYKRIRAGLEQRREYFTKLEKKFNQGSVHKPGSLNGKKTGTPQDKGTYSHRSRARNRSRQAVNSR